MKNVFSIFCSISEVYIKFSIFSKERLPLWLMYLGNYRLPNIWLDKYLEKPVSELPWTVNMLKRPNHL